jgi:hypothetical protein
MQNNLVFKTGVAKQTLGWSVCLGAAGALAAMIYAFCIHPENQTPAELWSGAVIGVFLIGLMLVGIAIQYARWSINGENIVCHRIFKDKTIPLTELAGFGRLIIIVAVIPLAHVVLYDSELKLVARLPISLDEWPRAEALLAAHLRFVINDGSAAFPKRRFADTPKT